VDRNLESFFHISGAERLARDNPRQWLAHEQKESPMQSFNSVGYNLALFEG
jgi:hypothetical protein